jgi:hypothetical protein
VQLLQYGVWMQIKSSFTIFSVLNIIQFPDVSVMPTVKFLLLYFVMLTGRATVSQGKNGYLYQHNILQFYADEMFAFSPFVFTSDLYVKWIHR